ncbi:MAG: hypothetical protein H0W46_08260 [Acidimicrobiia bacterium]|nr:hypothetical protein [Acidimicrobiia bacterium]
MRIANNLDRVSVPERRAEAHEEHRDQPADRAQRDPRRRHVDVAPAERQPDGVEFGDLVGDLGERRRRLRRVDTRRSGVRHEIVDGGDDSRPFRRARPEPPGDVHGRGVQRQRQEQADDEQQLLRPLLVHLLEAAHGIVEPLLEAGLEGHEVGTGLVEHRLQALTQLRRQLGEKVVGGFCSLLDLGQHVDDAVGERPRWQPRRQLACRFDLDRSRTFRPPEDGPRRIGLA